MSASCSSNVATDSVYPDDASAVYTSIVTIWRALRCALVGFPLIALGVSTSGSAKSATTTTPIRSARTTVSVTGRAANTKLVEVSDGRVSNLPEDPIMIFTSPENGAVVTASGRIDVTGNGGKHWSQAADANHVAAIDFVESSDGWAITWSNYTASGVRFGPLLYTSDGGRTWSKLPVPSEGPLVTVDFTDELVGYGVTSAGVFLFTNDGGGLGRRFDSRCHLGHLFHERSRRLGRRRQQHLSLQRRCSHSLASGLASRIVAEGSADPYSLLRGRNGLGRLRLSHRRRERVHCPRP